MKVGVLPYFDRSTIARADWVVEFLEMAEAEGCESVWMVEHVIVAENYEPLYEYSEDGRMPAGPDTVMPDPLEWLSFAAAVTRRIRLATGILIASQHSAAILAKRVATLDALSGGRLELGVGIGWQKEEYRAIGVPYSRRGKRLEETLAAMRTLWGPGPSSFKGEFVQFENVHCDPKPVQKGGVPILIGGSSEVAARRAGRIGNGYYPYVISPDDLAVRLEQLRESAQEAGRDPAEIEITAWPTSWKPGATFDLDLAKRYADLGVSRLMISVQESGGTTINDFRRLIGDYRDRVASKL